MLAPPARLTFSAPVVTPSCVVARLPSTSLALTPAIDSDVSSFTVWAPGTVFTGPSLTELTVIATASESVAPFASVDRLVSEAGERRIDLGLGTREGQRRGAIRTRADRRPAGQAHVERAARDAQLRS